MSLAAARPSRRRWAYRGAALLLGCAAAGALAAPQAPRVPGQTVVFAAMGDMPYGDDFASGQAYRALIELVNGLQPAFTVHVGDFKSGLAPCTEAEYERQAAYFKRFSAALLYTPGDNDWRDCHRRGDDPLERLQSLRRHFFAQPGTLGLSPIAVERQADRMPAYPQMVENLRWMLGGVAFATFHTVGPDNGLDSGKPAWRAEAQARDAANTAWIAECFAWSRQHGARALVLFTQAGTLYRAGGRPANRWEVSEPFQRSIGQTLVPLAAAAPHPVMLVHGDHHSFKFGQPFRQANGLPVRQLWRLEVPGDPRMHAIRVAVPADVPPGKPPFLVSPIWNPQSPDPRFEGR